MPSASDSLGEILRLVRPRLEALGEPVVSGKLSPDDWSAKEILGHLIDSASTNHQRLVRAQTTADLLVLSYEPDLWVATQHYQDAVWEELLALWHYYNLHIARVMKAIPEEHWLRPRRPHMLGHASWRRIPEDQPATLEDLMLDYVGHVKHHLETILAR